MNVNGTYRDFSVSPDVPGVPDIPHPNVQNPAEVIDPTTGNVVMDTGNSDATAPQS